MVIYNNSFVSYLQLHYLAANSIYESQSFVSIRINNLSFLVFVNVTNFNDVLQLYSFVHPKELRHITDPWEGGGGGGAGEMCMKCARQAFTETHAHLCHLSQHGDSSAYSLVLSYLTR